MAIWFEAPGTVEGGLLARALRESWQRATTPAPAPPLVRSSGRLTAADVAGVRFAVTTFGDGYQRAEVDRFLEAVAASLRELAAGRRGRVTAEDVVHVAFRPSHFLPGYDRDEVDAFLDRALVSLV